MSAVITYSEPDIDYEESTLGFASPSEALDDQGLASTRLLRCAWVDRLTLASQLKVAHRIVLTSGPTTRVFFKGDRYPHDDSIFVRNISSIRPVDGPIDDPDPRVAKYKTAKLTVNYTIQDFDPNQQDEDAVKYADEELSTAAEFLTLPSTSLFWDAGGTLPLGTEANVSRLIRMMEWVFTFTELDTIPQGLLINTGTVNDVSVLSRSLGITFPAETLLYNGSRSSRELFIEGARAWRTALRFTFRPQGWNKFFRDDVISQAPVAVFKAGGGVHKPYLPINFQSELGV